MVHIPNLSLTFSAAHAGMTGMSTVTSRATGTGGAYPVPVEFEGVAISNAAGPLAGVLAGAAILAYNLL